MSDISDALSKKVGPLPVGVWGVAVLGGLGVAVVIRRRAVSAPDPGGEYDAPATGGGFTNGGNTYTPPGSGNLSAPYDDDYDDDNDPANVLTQNQWRQQAVKALIAAGVLAIEAEAAIASYLAGKPLSPRQAELVNKAVAAIGPTPSPVPSPSVTTPGKPTPLKPKTPHPSTARTNEHWAQLAAGVMQGQGYPRAVTLRALRDWFKGRHLTHVEANVLQQTLARVGAPPHPPKRRPVAGHAPRPNKHPKPPRRRDNGKGK